MLKTSLQESPRQDLEHLRSFLLGRPRDLLLFEFLLQKSCTTKAILEIRVKDLFSCEENKILELTRGAEKQQAYITSSIKNSFNQLLMHGDLDQEDFLFKSRKGDKQLTTTSVSRLIRRINILGRTQFRIRMADVNTAFPKSTELFLFRICNELINNALKHSKATMANFDFYTEKDKFHLVYSDDGVGFAPEELSLEDEKGGLFNMNRRVESMDGKCWIRSKPDQGVEVEIVLDIK